MPHNPGELISATDYTTERGMEVHPSQRRISCELCRRSKTKCQRLQLDDPKCVRCNLANLECNTGQQKKVGRPKRKAPTFASEPEHPPATKRPNPSTNQRSQATSTNEEVSLENVFENSGMCEGPTRIDIGDVRVPRCYPNSRPAAYAPIPIMPGLESMSWPSAISDSSWYDNILPRAPSGRILTEPTSNSPWHANAAHSTTASLNNISRWSPTLVSPDSMNRALSHDSLPWISQNFRMASQLTSKYSLTKKRNHPLPFGIGRPPAYYIHKNQFSSILASVPLHFRSFDSSDAMARLNGIVHGLQLRSTMVQSNRSRIGLSLLVHRQGPLFTEDYSMTEYIMVSTEQLVQIAASLLDTRESTHRSHKQLPIGLISTIVDVYCRVLSFFELFLEHLTFRAGHISTTPVTPISNLKFNGVVLAGPRTQGTLFCSSIFYLLERVENVLGLEPTTTGDGLLSMTQINMLYKRLDRSNDLAQTRGIMRPADVKKLYMQVANILEQLALAE